MIKALEVRCFFRARNAVSIRQSTTVICLQRDITLPKIQSHMLTREQIEEIQAASLEHGEPVKKVMEERGDPRKPVLLVETEVRQTRCSGRVHSGGERRSAHSDSNQYHTPIKRLQSASH